MPLHSTPHYSLYFGDAQDNIYLNPETRETISINPFAVQILKNLQKSISLSRLVFLHQTHSTHGLTVSCDKDIPQSNFSIDGDFLITTLSHVGIGIFTADCLPLICYDRANHVAAVAHVGWKGALAGIVPNLINTLQKQYNTDLNQLSIFFGPSAQHCCYEVKDNFVSMLSAYPFAQQVIQKRNEQLFFDLPLFVQLQLEDLGIPVDTGAMAHHRCTMCNHQFFSHRRQNGNAGRQATLIALNNLLTFKKT